MSTWATQLTPFLADERVGEWVLIPDGDTVHIGTITGPATYVGPGARYARRRTVDWRIRDVPRTSLPRYATQILGTFQRNKAGRAWSRSSRRTWRTRPRPSSPVSRTTRPTRTGPPPRPPFPHPTTALRTHATLQNGLTEGRRGAEGRVLGRMC
ncbi:hypothetical protein ABT234_15585 [Streptomyces sp. NPDC001586]|uniref:hypothetical protein n=1 Tax=Streptomyces sp. NPDC001586 TaxID=3154387 RepID=UPI00332F83D0